MSTDQSTSDFRDSVPPWDLRSCRVRTRLGALTHSSDHVLALERKGEVTAVSVVLCPGRLSCRGQGSSIRGALPACPSPAPVLIPGICALTSLCQSACHFQSQDEVPRSCLSQDESTGLAFAVIFMS